MPEVRTAKLEDLPTIVDTAARSLDAEAMLRWSFGEERFEERIRRHFAHYDGENARRGWVRMAADGAGIAVWIPPDAREEHEAIPPAPPGGEAEILGETPSATPPSGDGSGSTNPRSHCSTSAISEWCPNARARASGAP